jgi:ABC-type Na+ efflux pump permease subunit
MLVGVAVRASTSISGERDRDTLDALLTSPLDSHDILFAKWLGSWLSVRWAWLWLWLIWGIGLATGAMHPIGAVLSSIAWLTYASCLSGIGLWYSIACRTTLRATLLTLGTTIALCGGHWVLVICCLPFGFSRMYFDLFALPTLLTPPAVFYLMAAPGLTIGESLEWEVTTMLAFFGLFLWALAALFLWSITRKRFRAMTSRLPYRRPELRALPRVARMSNNA